jgi:hypothetical protein
LGAIFGFLKFLYEHKEKIILGALIIAFTGVGYTYWKDKQGGDTPVKPPPVKIDPTDDEIKVQKYRIPNLGNRIPIDQQLALTDEGIFTIPEPTKGDTDTPQADVWPTIVIKSIFDATRSGTFIAIIEVDGKREFMKEGEDFQEYYEVRRIDGVRNCLTIVKSKSKSGEDEREFCK